MATVISKTLQLETHNVEQYCSANGLSLNAGGYAIRKWLNGSNSGYATLNNAAKNILYPTSTAHPFKLDSEIRGSRSAGSMTVNLEFGGTVVHSQSFTSTSLSTKRSTNITSSAVTSSTRNTQIRWNVKGKNGDNQRVAHVKLVLYFNQYTMSANKGAGANGVQSVSVSNSSPYQGDTVTFTATLKTGATFDGWYSDASCTQLVSTNQTYSTSAADLTLYAKATIASTVYTCSAVAGTNIASATVSDNEVAAGGSVTFTASVNNYCTFDGWYTASTGGTKVSGNNPYTATINSDTTLYARATANKYSAAVGAQPSYGTASVSSNSNVYGESITFTCTIDASATDKEFWGWYSDAAHTNLVSASATYTTTQPASALKLYPYIGDKRYYATITVSHMMDVKPFRFNGTGTYNNGTRGASNSLIRNQSNILGRTAIAGEIYAYQVNDEYDSDFNFGISFHFTEGAANIPDNANIVEVTAHIGLATSAGSSYKNMSLFAGEMNWINYNNPSVSQPDETAIVNRRGNAKSLTVDAYPTDYILSYQQMGTWTANELRNGICGVELDFTHSGNQSSLNIYMAKLEVVYTYNYTSYTCKAISEDTCDVFVMDTPTSNPRRYDSDLSVTSGQSCTWFARPAGGYRFDGWYSDSNYTTLVSSNPTYTATITNNITLYAKTRYVSRVVSRTLTVPFGSGATYYEGYYSDDGISRTATAAGSNGFQVDMDMSEGIYAFTGLDCDASLGSTNGKPYIYALLNNAAKDVLFPNATAHPVKMDWYNEAGRGAATIALNIVARNPLTIYETVSPLVGDTFLDYQRPSLIAGVGCTQNNLRDSCILNMTKSTDLGYMFVMTNASRSKAIGINSSTFTLYFEEYDFSAQIGENSKGVESVATNKATGYEGDSVTYTATLSPEAIWNGWYADPNCKTLVSTEQTYTTVPNSSLTLYAGASTNLAIYSCSAIAGENIASATVSDDSVIAGDSVTFTAQLNEGCLFDGWYTALTGGTKVSGDNPYTVIISSDTTLYARATKKLYTITLNQSNHGRATVSATTAYYDDQVTFTCYPDAGWQLLQWREHFESGGWIAVSKSNPYVMTIQGNVVISPFLTQINYNIRVGESEDGVASVSASTAHYGDNVVFTFTPNEGVDGNYGWYQDAELTQVVSRENPYVHTVTGDITLYPGVVQQINTGLYIKVSGTFVEANAVYKKVNGAWVKQTDIASIKTELQSGNYKSS